MSRLDAADLWPSSTLKWTKDLLCPPPTETHVSCRNLLISSSCCSHLIVPLLFNSENCFWKSLYVKTEVLFSQMFTCAKITSRRAGLTRFCHAGHQKMHPLNNLWHQNTSSHFPAPNHPISVHEHGCKPHFYTMFQSRALLGSPLEPPPSFFSERTSAFPSTLEKAKNSSTKPSSAITETCLLITA